MPPAVDEQRAELVVQLSGINVGVLRLANNLSTFELLDEYLESPRRPVLGQVFEEDPRGSWRQAMYLPPWFSNVLPEDPLLSYLAGELGINPKNEFRMLEALGSDLPGAVDVIPASSSFAGEVGPRVIRALDAVDDRDKPVIRFSVAGVQLKLSMIWSGNTLTLPGRGELGNHLVKFPSARYPGVPENEYSMMTWAAESGLDVPAVSVSPGDQLGELPRGFEQFAESTVYVIERYDRDGPRRIHQEDLNQVLANRPDQKYKGASYERLGLIVATLCGEADLLEYLKRLLFCIACGNEDAHLKNWSILYRDGLTPGLAPTYDMVSTIQYDELERGLALRLGRSKDVARIEMSTIERFASKVGAGPATFRKVAQEFLELSATTWRALHADLPISSDFVARLGQYHAEVPLLRPFFS